MWLLGVCPAVEALLFVKLMSWTCASAFHLPPIFDAFLDDVSLIHATPKFTGNLSLQKEVREENIPRGTCTSTLVWPSCRPVGTLQNK